MKYIQLLTLEIAHDYYADQRCNDFQIMPTPETQKLLKNCRCMLKSFQGGIQILMPIIEKGIPFIPLSADTIFAFYLRLQNPDFGLITDTTEIGKIASPLYTNTGVIPNLSLVSRQAKLTESLIVSQPAQKEQFILSGKPQTGLEPKDFVVQGLETVSNPDSYDPVAKTITLNSISASIGTQFTVTYPVAPQLNRSVFADVEINFKDAQMRKLDVMKNFKVIFTAKNARWKYYVVIDKVDNKQSIPTIEDKDKIVIFNIADRTDLTKVLDPSDDIAKKLAEQYPNRYYFRFVSNSFIPCRQTTRKAIQLQLDGEKVVDALPNPSFQNYTIDLRNSVKELSLYHIVQYFAR